MIQVLLLFWIASALLIIREPRFIRMIIYLSVFSLISSLCFIFFAAPDVALAEAVISVFSTIIYIISFEKYYSRSDQAAAEEKTWHIKSHVFSLIFTVFLFILFIWVFPHSTANSYLKERYLSGFSQDVGGRNAVTAIYLGYRLYDTLFETLILLVSITAIIHLSWYKDAEVPEEKNNQRSPITVYTIRIICPILIVAGFYLTTNGHLSPGGGFQGGVIAASFFIGRHLIYDINDIPIGKVITLEKIFYTGIILLAVFFISPIVDVHLPRFRIVYLVSMNLLIGMKVTCGFLIIFYRFIAFERR